MEKKVFKRRLIKRKRELPYRKWSDFETTLLMDYIKENEFEKPNGRIFYQTFVETFHMNIEWTLVKNKIRNLRTLYEKALVWQRSDAAKNIPDGETVQTMINRICPVFDSLKEVFGDKTRKDKFKTSPNQYNSTLRIEDSQNTVFKESYSPPSSPQHVSEEGPPPIFETITLSGNIMKESTNTDVNNHETYIQPEKIKTVENPYLSNASTIIQKHDACNCLIEAVKMMSSYQNEKCEYQRARLEMEHKRFDFEKEKTFRELELKQKEMEKNERIQVLEIESRERIAMQELEYRYKRL